MDFVLFGDDTTSVFSPRYKRMMHKTWKPRIHIHLQSQAQKAIQKKVKGPAAADLDLWTKSLLYLLSDQNGQMAFKTFLKSEFCEENLEFWLACEEFKCTKSKDILTSTAIGIYEQFIRTDSPKQINLDFHTRERITQSLQHPTTSCFVVAQRKIYHLMENDAYPRFIQSDFYKELHAAASKGAKKNHRRVLH
ncbi:regulator of G-protein signaling 21-like [Clupea harengus]|uniref:Regulator of G-protein signaling 21-like n=1 Tax=Clupea harengus TaxID=7950 RepID=A0A8M1KCI6_CLUHA|nr:regulator of G-protein signaling 21-like [Clupea harengus]